MNLKLEDYLYDLPEDRVAKYPAADRSDSKLLFYDKGKISHWKFHNIDHFLPEDSLLVFNDTKVIPARIWINKGTGAKIEIFLLEPLLPSRVHEEAMNAHRCCQWKCMIGNARKWKINTKLKIDGLLLTATRISNDKVRFEWGSGLTFANLLAKTGKIPLPPYLNRELEQIDEDRYQTVYAKTNGAVAAPTAGLHFTEDTIQAIQRKGIATDYVTLHVSAGTFQPIKAPNVPDHVMHNEQVRISKDNIENLLKNDNVIAVGTTAMRTLESIFWFGTKLLHGATGFFITKQDAYQFVAAPRKQALEAILDYMNKKGISKIGGQTEIFIYPGYSFQICNGLVTNYHLPGSTLILLVAAFIGQDWKKVYKEALEKEYRFLSYGDSSLLLKN